MKQRAWLLLGMTVPLLFGAWAWLTARRTPTFGPQWQPHKLGGFYEETHPVGPILPLGANADVVRSAHYIFDLRTGQGRYSLYGGLTDDDAGMWELAGDARGALRLSVTRGQRVARYEMPGAVAATLKRAIKDQAGMGLYEWDDTVALLTKSRLYRWKKGAAALQQTLEISDKGLGIGRIDPASRTLIYVDAASFTRLSAQDGHLIRRVVPQKTLDYGWMRVGARGRYALYGETTGGDASGEVSRALTWTVYETASGRAAWSFETPTAETPGFFRPDGTLYLLAVPARHVWEVRDGATGQVLRQLPLVPHARGAIFSSDGATLYSVANGVLYRQRAR